MSAPQRTLWLRQAPGEPVTVHNSLMEIAAGLGPQVHDRDLSANCVALWGTELAMVDGFPPDVMAYEVTP